METYRSAGQPVALVVALAVALAGLGIVLLSATFGQRSWPTVRPVCEGGAHG